MQPRGVYKVRADQCMLAFMTRTKEGQWVPAMKPNVFLTKSCEIAVAMNVRCDGSHQHQRLVDGRAARAASYPPELRQAIYRGLRDHLLQEAAGRLEQKHAAHAELGNDLPVEQMHLMPCLWEEQRDKFGRETCAATLKEGNEISDEVYEDALGDLCS